MTPASCVAITMSSLPSPFTSPTSTSRIRLNLPPQGAGAHRVSWDQAPSLNVHFFNSAFSAPIVRIPPSNGRALWNTLLSGSSMRLNCQPSGALRASVSSAGPGIGFLSLPS